MKKATKQNIKKNGIRIMALMLAGLFIISALAMAFGQGIIF